MLHLLWTCESFKIWKKNMCRLQMFILTSWLKHWFRVLGQWFVEMACGWLALVRSTWSSAVCTAWKGSICCSELHTICDCANKNMKPVDIFVFDINEILVRHENRTISSLIERESHLRVSFQGNTEASADPGWRRRTIWIWFMEVKLGSPEAFRSSYLPSGELT